MRRFEISDLQAEAILNMRLRSLRRLEEIELRKEHKALTKEGRDLRTLLDKEGMRWDRIVQELEKTRAAFGQVRSVTGAPPWARRHRRWRSTRRLWWSASRSL